MKGRPYNVFFIEVIDGPIPQLVQVWSRDQQPTNGFNGNDR